MGSNRKQIGVSVHRSFVSNSKPSQVQLETALGTAVGAWGGRSFWPARATCPWPCGLCTWELLGDADNKSLGKDLKTVAEPSEVRAGQELLAAPGEVTHPRAVTCG